MLQFWQEAWFYAWELFKFTTLFYVVWVPGFLVAALLACRFRSQAWNRVILEPKPSLTGFVQAVGLGIIASADRKTSLSAMGDLLSRAVSLPLAIAFLISSRNMTIYFWAIFTLSLGAEFASGQVLGALVMIALVGFALHGSKIGNIEKSTPTEPRVDFPSELPVFLSWRALLLSPAGWKAVSRFLGQEIGRIATSLIVGIVLGGIILAAGLQPWWPSFTNVFGYATLSSDVVNAMVGATLSAGFSLSPVCNLPVVHALFKTDGLGYPGIISFCLASVLHRSDVRDYLDQFGRKNGWALVGCLYGAAVLGGLGSTWIYAAFGFRPSLPPVRLIGKVFRALFR